MLLLVVFSMERDHYPKSPQKDLADKGMWVHEGDHGEELVIELNKERDHSPRLNL